ncbi:3-hydroxyacyl-CoA dehydrogenase NAD-binding domain-containing protein [Streptomyces sp. NPDC002888]|uniref:3-hydroxyacyl-CoA dehydrogenase NAD-binding domain-containing protein n=1 Tax=Streptomyces sp. NPDC002888 TaxID=3364668 RepID=UPI003689BD79
MATSPSPRPRFVLNGPSEDIRRVDVGGAGLVGSGITEVCARAGLDVVVQEAGPESAGAGRRRVISSHASSVSRSRKSGRPPTGRTRPSASTSSSGTGPRPRGTGAVPAQRSA